jgi:hypothetical protein
VLGTLELSCSQASCLGRGGRRRNNLVYSAPVVPCFGAGLPSSVPRGAYA